MRFSAVKYNEEDMVYYNPKTFNKDEDVIIFPLNEFDAFYSELVESLSVVKNIIGDALNPESTTNPTMDLERVEDWINLITEDVGLLFKFKMQTTLPSFQRSNSAKIKFTVKTPENYLPIYSKEEIQCLMGL
ncbi:hypothetical protein [Methanobacterium sp.]|uniref:hypothetical protein n=1 Tax=Methanobacterium sp. TaxID=2164 RepID=UPI003C7534A3